MWTKRIRLISTDSTLCEDVFGGWRVTGSVRVSVMKCWMWSVVTCRSWSARSSARRPPAESEWRRPAASGPAARGKTWTAGLLRSSCTHTKMVLEMVHTERFIIKDIPYKIITFKGEGKREFCEILKINQVKNSRVSHQQLHFNSIRWFSLIYNNSDHMIRSTGLI